MYWNQEISLTRELQLNQQFGNEGWSISIQDGKNGNLVVVGDVWPYLWQDFPQLLDAKARDSPSHFYQNQLDYYLWQGNQGDPIWQIFLAGQLPNGFLRRQTGYEEMKGVGTW
jgi:hypothetical protein